MKKIVFFVVGFILLITIPAIVYFVGQSQDIRSKAAPATTLLFSPTTVTKPVDEQFTVNVDMNTGTNNVTAVKVVVTFDSTKLEATSITNGAFAPKITASGVVAAGTASITVAANNTTAPMQGTGTIAIVRFKGKAATTAPVQLKFDTTTFGSGLTESTNVITTLGTASVNITASTSNVAEANAASQESIIVTTDTAAVLPTATPITKLTPTPTPTGVAVIPNDPTPTGTESALLVIESVGGGSDEVPVTGSTENTIALLVAGIGCVLFSGLLYSKAKQTV